MSEHHIQEHVDLIAKHEQEFLARRTTTEKLGDLAAAFAGSLYFVGLHIVLFGGWIAVNTLQVGHIRHFDPAPYSLLGTLVALEAILLASFILMRQSRIGRRSNERDHLMLQILLLMEKETTAVLGMDRQIAGKVGLPTVEKDENIERLSQATSIDDMAQTIKDTL